ncbi:MULTISPECIES: hypothetical protein [Streptomyces]|uniref:hypothetical protein n=1 Tax=Streptomyces TaxID=1883 RepID=UPI00167B57FF|nr:MULTISPECIES: hypothetical protein [Streptomyces]MBK3521512.1 hypothetical protein [Streptomyces sp. MBT70]
MGHGYAGLVVCRSTLRPPSTWYRRPIGLAVRSESGRRVPPPAELPTPVGLLWHLPTGHDCVITMPAELSELLLGLVP